MIATQTLRHGVARRNALGKKIKTKSNTKPNKEDTETEQRTQRKTALISVELAGVMTIEK
jgi:hypothetical protein